MIDEPTHEEVLTTSTEDIVQKVVTSEAAPTEIDLGKVGDTGVAFIETAVATTAEAPLTETTPAEMTSTDVDITMALAPSVNGRNISLGYHFSYIVSNHLDFGETLALTSPIIGSS